MKKRLLSLLLAAVMLLTILPTAAARPAEETETIRIPFSVLVDAPVAGVELTMRITDGLTYKTWEKSSDLRYASYIDNVANGVFAQTGKLQVGIFNTQNRYGPTGGGVLNLGYLVFEGTTQGQAIEILKAITVTSVDKDHNKTTDVLANLIIDLSMFDGTVPDQPEPEKYTFLQSTQLGLIEPWFLKSNCYLKGEDGAYLTEEELNGMTNYGFYFLHAEDLDDPNAALTAKAVINDADAICYDKLGDRKATVEKGSVGYMVTASYTEGIYTYELNDPIYVVFFVEDANGRQYDTVKTRNLRDIAASAANNSNFSATEKTVYTDMVRMYETITAHRANFTAPPELPDFQVTKPSTYGFGTSYKADASFLLSTQIVLIEPWGIQLNGYLDSEIGIKDAGVVVLHDKAGTYSSTAPTLRQILSNPNACVLSLNTGDVSKTENTAYGTKLSAIYNNEIYTYQLNKNMYTVFFYQDAAGVYHFGNVATRNILSIVEGLAGNTNYAATERDVYSAMIDMHKDVLAHRATFGLN